jgi:hypothetical protein
LLTASGWPERVCRNHAVCWALPLEGPNTPRRQAVETLILEIVRQDARAGVGIALLERLCTWLHPAATARLLRQIPAETLTSWSRLLRLQQRALTPHPTLDSRG